MTNFLLLHHHYTFHYLSHHFPFRWKSGSRGSSFDAPPGFAVAVKVRKSLLWFFIWVFPTKNRVILPPKWMVKIMENPIKMGWFGIFFCPYFWFNTHLKWNAFLDKLRQEDYSRLGLTIQAGIGLSRVRYGCDCCDNFFVANLTPPRMPEVCLKWSFFF